MMNNVTDDTTMRKKKGFIPVMLTPFRDTGEVDYDALTEITEFYLASGAVGLFANCLSSEMYDLTPEERLGITRHVVQTAGGKVPVVATGSFGKSLPEMADFVKRIYDTGVEAVILITSLLAAESDSDDVLEANTFRLMEMTDQIPLGFYECPLPYKRILKPELLKRFLGSNRVIYHKDTCLDIELVREKIAASRGFHFGLYDAYLVHAVESLRAGSQGLSCIQGNFFPEVIVWVCENYDDPALKEQVEKVQRFLTDNMDVMHAVYPPVAKYFLRKRGIGLSTFCRSTKATMDSSVEHDVLRLFEDCKLLKDEVNIPDQAR